MNWSAYMEECCHAIEEAPEYPSDATLVHLVKLQRLSHKFGQTLPYENIGTTWTEDIPVGMYVKALEEELQNLHHSLPLESYICIFPIWILIHGSR
jgi:hypothetical protein